VGTPTAFSRLPWGSGILIQLNSFGKVLKNLLYTSRLHQY
jgi:hypothetical protein